MLRSTFRASLFVALAACASESSKAGDCETGKCDQPNERAQPQLCAAIRGNGQLITAHFASLARITEHYGLIDAAAGGSSGSISIFMTESIRKNPNIWSCGGYDCSERERAARAALLLKSFPGYLQHLSTTKEAAAFLQLQPLVAKIQNSGVEALLDSDIEGARTALLEILTSDDLKDLINPELVTLVTESPDPEFHIRDILESAKKLGNFAVDTDLIFIRPGLISFESIADKLGRAGSFYAGYGPADQPRISAWLDACAEPGLGKTWFEVASLPAGDSTCGGELDSMLASYRTAFIAGGTSIRSRIDDKVGEVMPALISTSVVTGASVDAFQAARDAYKAASPIPIGVKFSDVKFGYFGNKADLATVAKNGRGYTDAKTQKFTSLGEATWREVISYSPAEPGLSRALELPSGDVSFGGWSDLAPTLVLENLGCEKVVYVTRTGEESGFAVGIAKLLGMDSATETKLYDLDNADSAFSMSLSESDASWCTNWNEQSATDLPGITADSYSAPMESSDEFFTRGDDAYPKVSSSIGKRGCSVGQ
jgi:hypothetical protein